MLRLAAAALALPIPATLLAAALAPAAEPAGKPADAPAAWVVDSPEQWERAAGEATAVTLADGLATSAAPESRFSSALKTYESPRKPGTLTFTQSPAWDDWREVPNVGTPEMADAPVFVPVQPGDYWLLARHKDFNGPDDGGYHAWHSEDMKTWTHHGPVCGKRERWVTTAEYVDGAFYIYYDFPNDEDPHLIVDRDLRDGKMGEDRGMAFNDPSHGSDAGVLREEDGTFHLFYENWDPINAKAHSWDSPLAGRAVSPDGVQPFEHANVVVDERTNPTGKTGKYRHPHGTYQYEIHEPEQNAYGDWTAIKIGDRYYLFCDFDPVGEHIRVGRWTSDALDKKFDFCGSFGDGHPDPTVGFAEGQFYLIQQRADVDFVSPGPWVGGVQARAGVDVDGDGAVDQWTDWQEVRETYRQKPGFVRLIEKTPATLDLTALPAGVGFQFEYRTAGEAGRTARPAMDRVEWTFE
ncbi:hypothetical protein [Alienimonas sp. DA493]|uniref:hypothetical protein n=1 Tax=Alienimonas sp. DA493 TaxID=3373605 RepID=UPI0037548171